MYIVMYRSKNKDEKDTVNCIFDNLQLAIEQYCPMGIDHLGRCIMTMRVCNDNTEEYEGFYIIEIDLNRSSLINDLVNETITNYLFEKRW